MGQNEDAGEDPDPRDPGPRPSSSSSSTSAVKPIQKKIVHAAPASSALARSGGGGIPPEFREGTKVSESDVLLLLDLGHSLIHRLKEAWTP